jgi:VWFA-related protein
MLQFVKEQLKPGQRVAVFTLTNSLEVLSDFTSDPEVLLKVLQQYQPREQEMASTVTVRPPSTSSDGGARVAQAALAMTQRIRDFQEIQVAYVEDRRVQTTLSAMRSLSRILSGIPGRKNVVWVTAAFPFSLIPEDRVMSEAEMAESLPTISQLGVGTRASGSVASTQRQSHAQEIREAASELANAQVAIYPVDARGLVSGMEATIEDAPARRIDDPVDAATLRISDVTASQETMREMARETGGVAYVNQNDIKNGAALATNDSAASYTLGYYPSDKKWDGKYRSIKVKLNHDGTDIRYRRGYFAIDPSQVKDRKPEQEVGEALQDSAPDTEITFSAQVKTPEKGKAGIDFLIDANTLSTEDASNGKHVNMSIYAASYGKDGKMLSNRSQKVDQTFPAETFQQILKQGVLMHLDLDTPAGAEELRMAVLDNRTGRVGTLRAELTNAH